MKFLLSYLYVVCLLASHVLLVLTYFDNAFLTWSIFAMFASVVVFILYQFYTSGYEAGESVK